MGVPYSGRYNFSSDSRPSHIQINDQVSRGCEGAQDSLSPSRVYDREQVMCPWMCLMSSSVLVWWFICSFMIQTCMIDTHTIHAIDHLLIPWACDFL